MKISANESPQIEEEKRCEIDKKTEDGARESNPGPPAVKNALSGYYTTKPAPQLYGCKKPRKI